LSTQDSSLPLHCDFYIRPLDQYVELNLFFTHGKHPFDATNPQDVEKLKVWQQKAQTFTFYRNAIKVWTQLDVQKRNTAKKQNLNYVMIYNLQQYEDFKNDIQRRYKE